MAYWFYYTTDGQKQGAVTEEQLKELAATGKITPGTMLEHQSGDKTVANEVKWLTFGESIAPTLQSHPTSINASFRQTQAAATSHGAEKTSQPFGEKMQNVGKGMQSAGKNITGGCCGCATLLFVLFVIIGIFSPPEKKEQQTDTSVITSAEENFPRIFKDIFLRFYDKINGITFEEALTLIKNNYDAETTVPYEENGEIYGMYSIKIKDDSDMYVVMQFSPNDKDKDALSLIAYGNSNYQISLSNNHHMSKVTYKTYDVDREPRNVEVSTLDELTHFIFVDAKKRAKEYRESVESLEDINVELAVETIIDSDERISFVITTNLPDNVVLMLTLQEDGKPMQPGSTRQGKVSACA